MNNIYNVGSCYAHKPQQSYVYSRKLFAFGGEMATMEVSVVANSGFIAQNASF